MFDNSPYYITVDKRLRYKTQLSDKQNQSPFKCKSCVSLQLNNFCPKKQAFMKHKNAACKHFDKK